MKNEEKNYKIGIDAGSTTLKLIALNSRNEVEYKVYKRHKADIHGILAEELQVLADKFPGKSFTVTITGSAGMGMAERLKIPFLQEVVASAEVVNRLYPETSTLIDLGGEDAKMVFFRPGKQPDIRMNGNCAGGTGAFIDQMADLMNITVDELGNQALEHEKTYTVASRCGVFAKTDVQNLICRNIPIPDVSMSILQTVALQTITSLARGYEIQPKVLCIGGPLTFLPALREAFAQLLHLDEGDLVLPEHSNYFPALGCALHQGQQVSPVDLTGLIARLSLHYDSQKDTMPVLFHDQAEYRRWQENRKIKKLNKTGLENLDEVECFLGIDSGSTTTKILIMDDRENIIYQFYDTNEGNPLKKVVEGLNRFYEEAKEKGVKFKFAASAATGYGEEMVKSALNLDFGIVETMAHLSGAQYADPEVSFVLDIGGQDMKSIFTTNGVISNIELNESCSSGCGSFLQNFSATMNMPLDEFSEAACLAQHPSDLGSRCTVFMNSKVKQGLRDGASLGDIAAGLAYSVVKNCLFKVLKISNLNELGDHIVVQGGTFRNDAVYRALEILSEKSVSSTDHPELMGALGAALYARKCWKNDAFQTRFTGNEPLPEPDNIETKEFECKGCTNRCSVQRFDFANGNTCYGGNKCEKVFFNRNTALQKGYNAFEKKNEILFKKYEADGPGDRMNIGIPRVLNMFENYPFWQALFAECGFKVTLSPESTFALYQKGIGSVMSDNICFPAKLVHGHILSLVESGIDRIFYPMVIKEEKEFENSVNSFNCPIVSGYPDVIRSSIDPEAKFGIPFDKPVITFNSEKALEKSCYQYFAGLGISKEVFKKAFRKALTERESVKDLLRNEQRSIFEQALQEKRPIFVVAGRPYHADPLIHQKVGQILSDLGGNVFTDDIFVHKESEGFRDLNLVSQWSYPNRVVQAAMEVAKLPQHVQLVQLNSFGCGPDSFFMDETQAILRQSGKNHTMIRIDEISSPGSIRLRLRSLVESLKSSFPASRPAVKYQAYPSHYKKDDRRKTILAPWFADFISPFIPVIGELAGYKIVNLPKTTKASADAGLKYGHNEVCYPSTLVLGDIITALQSGKYDLRNVVVAITQTGGQCRATNYISQIKTGMTNAGFSEIPVIVFGSGKVYQNQQKDFKISFLPIINTLIYTVLYADALQQMYSTTIIREKKAGMTQDVFDFYVEEGIKVIREKDYHVLLELLEQAVADFNTIPVYNRKFTRIGLIGEIYVKYNNYGQAHITEWLREQKMEVVTPPILDFVMQYFVNSETNRQNGVSRQNVLVDLLGPALWKFMNSHIHKMEKIKAKFRFYQPMESIYTKAEYASEILDLSNQFGEGWMVAGEIASYAHQGINKVVCIQPFGCIANHIVAKGIEKRLRKIYPDMNLLYLDIDGGIADVNLQNRLHFMINE